MAIKVVLAVLVLAQPLQAQEFFTLAAAAVGVVILVHRGYLLAVVVMVALLELGKQVQLILVVAVVAVHQQHRLVMGAVQEALAS
jgi:hypothetical protein